MVTTTKTTHTITTFDEANPKYRCCCGKIHVKTATLIIAVLLLIFNILGGVISLVLFIIVAILLFVGVLKEMPKLIIPAIVIMAINIFYKVAMVIAVAIYTCLNPKEMCLHVNKYMKQDINCNSEDKQNEITYATWGAVGVYIVIAVIEIWLTYVVYCCYCYLRDKNAVMASLPRYTRVDKEFNVDNKYPTFVKTETTETTTHTTRNIGSRP